MQSFQGYIHPSLTLWSWVYFKAQEICKSICLSTNRRVALKLTIVPVSRYVSEVEIKRNILFDAVVKVSVREKNARNARRRRLRAWVWVTAARRGASRPNNRCTSFNASLSARVSSYYLRLESRGIFISRRKAAVTSNLPYIHTPSAYSILDTTVIYIRSKLRTPSWVDNKEQLHPQGLCLPTVYRRGLKGSINQRDALLNLWLWGLSAKNTPAHQSWSCYI